jgi:transposase
MEGIRIMGSTRRAFTTEYKANAVALVVEDHRSIAEVARSLGIGETSLGYWVKKAKNEPDAGDRRPGETEREKLERLERENKELRLEVEFLKKAAAWFARNQR